MSAPFNSLVNMVLSHATEEGANDVSEKGSAGAKSLVNNLKSMLAKPKKAA